MDRRKNRIRLHLLAKTLTMAAIATMQGCGNLTAGGIGEASVAMSGDAPDAAFAAQPAVVAPFPALGSEDPAAVSEPSSTNHLTSDPEGEVEAELSVFLMAADGDLVALTDGIVRVRVDLNGVQTLGKPVVAPRGRCDLRCAARRSSADPATPPRRTHAFTHAMSPSIRRFAPIRPALRHVLAVLGLGIVQILGATAVVAQEPDRPTAPAVRVDAAPTVDGVPDDDVWQEAPALTDFTQRVPSDGQAATETTEVRFVYDDEALYVGIWAWDSNAQGIVSGEAIRDYDLLQSDAVILILDTFRDEQNAFVFGTNPVGIEYDGQVANSGQGGGRFFGAGGGAGARRQQGGAGGGFNLNWDGSWTVQTSRDSRGWYAEFRIPFSTLRYGEGDEQSWGLNIVRRVRRLNEESFWAPIPREFDQYRLNYAGVLESLEPPAQRLVRVTPYVLQKAVRDYQAGDTDFDYPTEVGGDAKVQITQGLTLDLTVNTDFAQVEVDEVQTNLTRFSLFFPEKRPFFLENAGFFQVGGGGAELFFSRRIGISSEGPVPILGGGRVSGRTAGLNVGALHIVTNDLSVAGTEVIPQTSYSVARVAQELPNRSRIGGAFLRRASGETNDWNHTYAVDGQLGIGDAWTFSSWLSRTETPGLDGRDHAFDIQGEWTSRRFRSNATYRQVGEDFNPELGFLPRDGYHYTQTFGMVYFRPGRWNLREVRPHVSYFTYRDIETGFEETSRVHVDSHFEFEDGMEFHPAFNWVREGLEEPFDITDEITVPAGTYEGWETGWVFFTDESAGVSFNGGLNMGSFLSGSRVNPYGTVTGRYGSKISASLRVDYNDVELDEGSFDVTVVGLRLAYFFTPRISVQSLTQYSDLSDAWSTNVRLAWLDDAGSGLFVVYNQANGFESSVATLGRPLNRAFTVKYSRLFDLSDW